ncbi:MAG: hypothetical protein ABTQ32_21005 [Myxococcaceae bacterium]
MAPKMRRIEEPRRRLAQVKAIEAGIAAADAGDLVPHEQVKQWVNRLGKGRAAKRPAK